LPGAHFFLSLLLVATTCAASAAQEAAGPIASTTDYSSLPLKSGEGRAVALKLADELVTYFPIPRQAQAYSTMLRANAAQGHYDTGTRGFLAELLTRDLMAVHKDGHLKIFVADPALINAPPSPPKDLPPPIQSATWIAPGIAYIRSSAFLQKDDEIQAFRTFMDDHRDARTIIFDLRNNHGGGNAESDIVFSYLFAAKTPLTRLEMTRATYDETGWPFPATQTLEVTKNSQTVTGTRYALPGKSTPLRSAKVLVLVSNATASAAEGFATSLKSTGRGALIGEATAGADHFGEPRPIDNYFGVFMPIGRTYDVRTGKDWEGTGIQPDIAVDPRKALVVALEKAGVSHEEALRLDAKEIPAEPVHREHLQAR
jgi:peptidase S41-like protein